LIPFFGKVDWEGFTKGLKDISFEDVISLDTLISPKMPEPMKETLQQSLADVARYLASNASIVYNQELDVKDYYVCGYPDGKA
jgi:hypothetical protein